MEQKVMFSQDGKETRSKSKKFYDILKKYYFSGRIILFFYE